MKIEQLSEILGKQSGNSNAERMNEAVRTVLTKDAELRSKGQRAYNEARQRDFEKKLNKDMKHPQKRTFAEMVRGICKGSRGRCGFDFLMTCFLIT